MRIHGLRGSASETWAGLEKEKRDRVPGRSGGEGHALSVRVLHSFDFQLLVWGSVWGFCVRASGLQGVDSQALCKVKKACTCANKSQSCMMQ